MGRNIRLPWQRLEQKKLEEDEDLLENVKAHPLVKQAAELFGGNVVSVQRIQHSQEEEVG